jgi:hypothetical protein
MIPFRRKKAPKSFPVKVFSLDSQLEFELEMNATGKIRDPFALLDLNYKNLYFQERIAFDWFVRQVS